MLKRKKQSFLFVLLILNFFILHFCFRLDHSRIYRSNHLVQSCLAFGLNGEVKSACVYVLYFGCCRCCCWWCCWCCVWLTELLNQAMLGYLMNNNHQQYKQAEWISSISQLKNKRNVQRILLPLLCSDLKQWFTTLKSQNFYNKKNDNFAELKRSKHIEDIQPCKLICRTS